MICWGVYVSVKTSVAVNRLSLPGTHTFFELQERRSIAAEKIWRFVSAR